MRKLLVIDTAFSFQAIRFRGLEDSVTCRDLNGYFSHVWSVHPFGSLVSDNLVEFFGSPDVHQINKTHTFIDGKFGRFSSLKFTPKLNFILAQIELIIRLVYLIKKERISVVRAADPLYNGLLGFVLSRVTRIPLLVRVGANHDKIFETTGKPMMPRLFPSRSIEKKIGQFVLARADCVAGANQDNLNFAIANAARPERTTLFRYGNLIDKLHFSAPDSRNVMIDWLKERNLASYKFLLYVGRLEPVKHADDVVKVLGELRRRGHKLNLLMVGDGQMRDNLVNLASEIGVSDDVVFCGNQNQSFLASIFPLAAVVLSPHTGRALTEAALAGARVVAYDIDWQREMIESGVTGELVQHKDWMQMANATDKILKSPPYAKSIGDALRKRALLMMDPDKLDEHERNTYSIILDGSLK
jgi:glycosyltransferase involved in cell wall biosynthesis